MLLQLLFVFSLFVLHFSFGLSNINTTSHIRRNLASTSSCDLTLFEEWKTTLYDGELLSDTNFWQYQTRPQLELTNWLALQLALKDCKRLFTHLYTYRAGRMGPITVQDSYKIMCRTYCLESDDLHQAAMEYSGCSCLELSTQSTEVSYTKEGDFCYHNSARLLCDMVGYCGVWNCRIDDFMCPRYEWNKKLIPYKGLGNCIRGSAFRYLNINLYSILFSILLIIFSFSL